MPLAMARANNQAVVEHWLATYTRLEAQIAKLNERFHELGEPLVPRPKAVDRLRVELEQHFAPGSDGIDAVKELASLKERLELEVAEAESLLQKAVADLPQRFRRTSYKRERLEAEIAVFRSWATNVLLANCPPVEREKFHSVVNDVLEKLVVPPFLKPGLNREAIDDLRKAEAVIEESFQVIQSTKEQLNQHLQKLHGEYVREAIGAGEVQKISDYITAKQKTSGVSISDKSWPKKLDVLLAKVASLQDTDFWAGIVEKAERIKTERGADRRRLLYDGLVLECDARLRQLREFKAWQAKIHQMTDAAAPFHDGAVKAILAELEELERIGKVQDLTDIERRLEDAKTATQKQSEREEKRQAILQALTELGYEIAEGMETALVRSGKIIIQKGGESEYAIEMVTDTDLSMLQTSMIRYGEGTESTEQQRLRDREQEEAWCSDHRYIGEKLVEHGFAHEFALEIPAGTQPVKVVQSRQPRTQQQSSKRARTKGL
jgi:hypothetical protein